MAEFEWKRKQQKVQIAGDCSRFCGPATMMDDEGHGWCDACRDRYRFMQWGKGYNFPDLNFPPYALAPDAEVYFYQAILARDDYIQSAIAAMIEIDRMLSEQDERQPNYATRGE